MDLSEPVIISAEEVNPDNLTDPTHIKVVWMQAQLGGSFDGFSLWHDVATGSTTPVLSDSADIGIPNSEPSSDDTYDMLVAIPLSRKEASWWETFSEYKNGFPTEPMSDGGRTFSGSWAGDEPVIGLSFDDFQSYPVGTNITMTNGTGWNGGWA